MLDKILVATISSEPDQAVFAHALMLAKATGAHLGLLYVTDPDETAEAPPAYLASLEPVLSGEDESEPTCYVGHFETQEPELFGKLVTKATAEGISTDCIHCFGEPEQAISDLALVWQADLIVLGRRGRSGIAEFFLGSVSNYTLHHAPCSVYVVHVPPSTKPEKALEQDVKIPH